jgi:hypothetical protein
MDQEKALLLLFSLSHVDLGHLIYFLLTALTGPVALPATIATDIFVARDAFAVTSRALLATAFGLGTSFPAATAVIGHAVAGT